MKRGSRDSVLLTPLAVFFLSLFLLLALLISLPAKEKILASCPYLHGSIKCPGYLFNLLGSLTILHALCLGTVLKLGCLRVQKCTLFRHVKQRVKLNTQKAGNNVG